MFILPQNPSPDSSEILYCFFFKTIQIETITGNCPKKKYFEKNISAF
jgi:hypothetical protein